MLIKSNINAIHAIKGERHQLESWSHWLVRYLNSTEQDFPFKVKKSLESGSTVVLKAYSCGDYLAGNGQWFRFVCWRDAKNRSITFRWAWNERDAQWFPCGTIEVL